VDADQGRALWREVWRERLRIAAKPLLAGTIAIAVIALKYLDPPLSIATSTCTLVRWTVVQVSEVPANTYVYCDLPDGRTIVATTEANWIPRAPGSALSLEIVYTFFGTRYHVR
jgi:hypothetical protein